MLANPAVKYDAFPRLYLPSRKWPGRALAKPPRWLSTDLRDGNQALVQPMDGYAKLRYFEMLVKLGFKEIEISYPSASQTEFEFTRRLVGCPGIVPNDVWLQVMAPCRENLIHKTIESVQGANQVIVHLHLSTSECFRRVVFDMTATETIGLATRCARLVRELTKDSHDPALRKTQWTLEFTVENFQDTSIEFAVEICEAVKLAWGPTEQNQIIFNLPSTVEMAMPNIFADQIEWFCENITEREKVCVSLHNHNDRGCAVAAAEMGQLAGADRVEGCLFGNGERTGNVDLVTLALNMYTQGIWPGLDFSDINHVVGIVEDLTKIPVHLRAPYAGKYVFCTFTGTHQDAIRKGRRASEAHTAESQKWKMPYLPMDPRDLGREHEAVIRVNSQSGKSGIAWLLKSLLGIEMPQELEGTFASIVKAHAEATGLEITPDMIESLFRQHYMLADPTDLQLLSHGLFENTVSNTSLRKEIDYNRDSDAQPACSCFTETPMDMDHHSVNGGELLAAQDAQATVNENIRSNLDGSSPPDTRIQSSNAVMRNDNVIRFPVVPMSEGDVCKTKFDIRAVAEEVIRILGFTFQVLDHQMQAVDTESRCHNQYASFVKIGAGGGSTSWGVGIDGNPGPASMQAVLSAAKRLQTRDAPETG